MSDKQRKVFRIIIIVLAIVLIGELIYFGVRFYISRQNSVFYSVVNSAIISKDDSYIGVGFSDYKNSDFNDYEDGINKATIFVNENGKISKEIGLSVGYNSYFNDIVKTDDGYVAVGKIEMTKDQKEEKLSEGLVVKYDKDFNVVWRKNVSILGETELLKVKLTKDNDIVVVGTSVYGEGYVGNHTSGGGILLKFNQKGKEELRVNNGGPYHGRFNDVIVEKDGYVVVGLGKSNSGIIIKYDLKGKKLWSGSYGYTDKNGINAVEKFGNKYITATTKVINPKELNNYSAALVLFSNKGKKLDDVKYTSSDITYFSDVKVLDDNIIACGYTGKLSKGKLVTDALVVKYDEDLYEESSDVLKGENSEFYNNIYLKDDSVTILGYSNSDLEGYDLNGYDYFPIVKKYNSDLK